MPGGGGSMIGEADARSDSREFWAERGLGEGGG